MLNGGPQYGRRRSGSRSTRDLWSCRAVCGSEITDVKGGGGCQREGTGVSGCARGWGVKQGYKREVGKRGIVLDRG